MKTKYCLIMILSITSMLFACNQKRELNKTNDSKNAFAGTSADMIKIGSMLDSFNSAAARADYTAYFNLMANDATFIGTDATEYWNKENFMVWTKPYFIEKNTWDFRSIERHIYFDKYDDIAWFDELLSTQMKICRGSGVVVKQNNEWKIKQYVLSMTIPNSNTKEVTKLKAMVEDSIIGHWTITR